MEIEPRHRETYDRLIKYPREVLAKYIIISAVIGIQFDVLDLYDDERKICELRSLLSEYDDLVASIPAVRRARIVAKHYKRSDLPLLLKLKRMKTRINSLNRCLKIPYQENVNGLP